MAAGRSFGSLALAKLSKAFLCGGHIYLLQRTILDMSTLPNRAILRNSLLN